MTRIDQPEVNDFSIRIAQSGLVTRPILLGNLELFGYPTDHTKIGWNQNGKDLTTVAALLPIISLEYCPPEYAHIYGWPGIGPYFADMDKKDNYLYHQMVEFSQREGKDILMVDPAYKASFIAFRYSPHILLGVSAAVGGTALIVREMRQGRRGFLHFGLAAASSSLLIAIGINPQGPEQLINELAHWKMPYEDPLRDSSSAEQALRFGQSLSERKRALMVTTKKHWEEFVKYALNDALRARTLAQFDPLRAIPSFDSFFRTRYYPQGVINN